MRAGCSLRPSPTRNRRRVVASIVVALLAAVGSACTDSPSTPLRPTASPPPNPTTLTGITVSNSELMVVEGESATIVVTLDSDPGEDIEVQVRLVRVPHRGLGGRDPDDVTLTPESVTWTATDWQQPRMVARTAIADKVRELVETHEVQVWTYVRGKTGAGQHILAAETVQATTADSRGLVALMGGSEGEIVLEWTPADQRTQRWQYREKAAWALRNGQKYAPTWSAWTDMPNSDADTRSFRVTGLTMRDWIYDFQIRPWGARGPGAASAVIEGYVATVGPDGIPQETPGPLLEPGRRFRHADTTFVVPDGMILSTRRGGDSVTRETFIFLYDETTITRMVIRSSTGETVQKTIWDPLTKSYQAIWTETGDIAESWSGVPPPPGHDIAALWEQIEQSIRREPLPSQ